MQRSKTFSRYLSQIDDTRAHLALERLSRQNRDLVREDYVPRIDHAAILAANKALSPFYSSTEELFQAPEASSLESLELRVTSVAPAVGGEITRIEFDSAYRSQIDPRDSSEPVVASIWKHATGNARARMYLICEQTETSRLSALRYAPQYWFSLGFDVVMLEVQQSFRKQVELENGAVDLLKLHDFLASSIHAFRELRSIANEESHLPEGIISYGFASYIMSLWASLDSFDFAIASQPLVSLEGHLLDSIFGSAPEGSVAALAQAKDRLFPRKVQESLSNVLACAGPLSMTSKVPADACLILGAEAAQDLSARQLVSLAEHWDSSPMVIPGSTFSQFYRPELRALVRDVLLNGVLAEQAETSAVA